MKTETNAKPKVVNKHLSDLLGFEVERSGTINTADEKKLILLEMARRGEPRPSTRGIREKDTSHTSRLVQMIENKYTLRELQNALRFYCNSNHSNYDCVFYKQIRQLRPDWFVSQTDVAKQKKEQLIEMAQNGDIRPHSRKTEIGKRLIKYTCKVSGAYDADFDIAIRRLAPHWFENIIRIESKKKLLEMAKNGEPKPRTKPLQHRLFEYCNKKRTSYDIEFDVKIRNIRPDWFESTRIRRSKQQIKNAIQPNKTLDINS